jgi:hypothetical protein
VVGSGGSFLFPEFIQKKIIIFSTIELGGRRWNNNLFLKIMYRKAIVSFPGKRDDGRWINYFPKVPWKMVIVFSSDKKK